MSVGRLFTWLFGGLAAVAAGLSALLLVAPEPEPSPAEAPSAVEAAPASPSDPTDDALAEAANELATVSDAAAPAAGEAGAARAPAFDVVRVERDGAAIAAGAAEPDSEIRVLVDGETRATARADGAGGFVAFFDVPTDGEAEGGARRIELVAEGPDGARRSGEGPVIVAAPDGDAPDAEPLVVATRESGLEILQRPDSEESDAGVSLDMATQEADGSIALSGRAGGLKPLRIYANARLVAETVADADGRWTAVARAGAAEGAATLRIDEIGSDGSVARRIEAPFELPEDDAEDRAIGRGEIVVQRGDTLWRIAENLLGGGNRFTVIYEANRERIRDPDIIFPGQLLTVPGAAAAQ